MKFDIDKLAQAIQEECPQVCFALLHGSAKDGTVRQGSDIDIALFIEGAPSLEIYQRVSTVVAQLVPTVTCDVGVLNDAEPVYRFEALKGRVLFTRDQEKYLSFFSLTCREYEYQMADYQRQHTYRLQAG